MTHFKVSHGILSDSYFLSPPQDLNMPVNSSSNASLLSSPFCFSDRSLYPLAFSCFSYNSSSIIYITFTLTCVLLLPLNVLVLWRASRRWHRQCSTQSGTTSHSDVFTCKMVAIEIINTLGSVFTCVSAHTCSNVLMLAGFYLFFFSYLSQTFFHCLTCVERYLAVVHPVAYRGLRGAGGVMARNISIGCVWLLCFGVMALSWLYYPDIPAVELFTMQVVVIGIVSFCSLSVLRVMNHLGLGKVGGSKEQIDPAKRRAFYTIVNITGTLILRSFGLAVTNAIFTLDESQGESECLLLMVGAMLCLPSSLVPSLLFLYRGGKLSCFGRFLSQGGK